MVVFRFYSKGDAAGALTTHIDDILRCGGPDILVRVHEFSGRRFGDLKAQEKSFLYVGMEAPQMNFTKSPKPFPNAPTVWAPWQRPSSLDEIEKSQSKLQGSRRLATVSRPAVCARLARLAAGGNFLLGCDIYRINDLVETVNG